MTGRNQSAPDSEALRLAREFVADPDKRAQVKVQLEANGWPQLATMIDEAVTVSRALLALSDRLPTEKIVGVTRDFDYLGNNINAPWVKVCFAHEDWAARDAFANALGNSAAPTPNSHAEPLVTYEDRQIARTWVFNTVKTGDAGVEAADAMAEIIIRIADQEAQR